MSGSLSALLSAGFIVLCLPCIWCQTNYFTLTYPNKLRSDSEFVVAATYHGFPGKDSAEPLKLDVRISKDENVPATNTKGELETSGSISIPVGTTKQLPIKVGNFPSGRYSITTNVSGPISEVSHQTLDLSAKTFSTFIQTDKVMYQPSQLVQFRVIVVDSNLIPYNKESLLVLIKDPQGNIIKQWSDAQRIHGIFQGKLHLSDQPVMGDWTIETQIGSENSNKDKTTTATFTVKEYVLPQFEVKINTPYVTFKNNDNPSFTITVTAKYTFGGAVNGNLSMSLDMAYCPFNWAYDWHRQQRSDCHLKPLKVEVPIDGSATITVKASELYEHTTLPIEPPIFIPREPIIDKRHLSAGPAKADRSISKRMVIIRPPRPFPRPPPTPNDDSPYRDTTVNVLAAVTEALTGIQLNQTATVTIYAADEQLTMERANIFKPGMPFEVTVKLSKRNNEPVTNSANESVTLTTNFDADKPRNSVFKDGVAVFTITPPISETSLEITVKYKDLKISETVEAAKSKSTKFISISVNTKEPVVGKKLNLQVQTTFGMQAPLSYVVVGRGNIRKAGSVSTGGQSLVKFSIPVTSFMAPHARIVVYYIDSADGEMIADSMDINVGGTFRNPVSLEPNITLLEPAETLSLTIKTHPHSLVALQAVDLSVLLLKSGNDITQEKVYNELQSYDIGNNVVYHDDFFEIGYWRRPNYGESFQKIFEYVGLILTTNGHYYVDPYIEPPWWHRRRWWHGPMAMARGMAMVDSIGDANEVDDSKS